MRQRIQSSYVKYLDFTFSGAQKDDIDMTNANSLRSLK